jgi:hypothetical protein
MEYVVALLVLGVVVAVVVLRPLLAAPQAEAAAGEQVAALEAAKEAKYREIRDAELDHRTGKLSVEDWRELDRELRGQAIGILKRLDEIKG